MNPVIQKEKTGCGIASVATLVGVGYDSVKTKANRLGIFAEDPKLWSDIKYVRTLLRKFGVSVSKKERKFVSWEKLPTFALLAVKWHLEKDKPFWHFMVFFR